MILQPYMKRSPFVVHRDLPYDIYCGRPSRWGNPFSHKAGTLAQYRVATRIEAVNSYARWLMTQPVLLDAIPVLAGAVLGCWCDNHKQPFNPEKHLCHCHVLAWLANGPNFHLL